MMNLKTDVLTSNDNNQFSKIPVSPETTYLIPDHKPEAPQDRWNRICNLCGYAPDPVEVISRGLDFNAQPHYNRVEHAKWYNSLRVHLWQHKWQNLPCRFLCDGDAVLRHCGGFACGAAKIRLYSDSCLHAICGRCFCDVQQEKNLSDNRICHHGFRVAVLELPTPETAWWA